MSSTGQQLTQQPGPGLAAPRGEGEPLSGGLWVLSGSFYGHRELVSNAIAPRSSVLNVEEAEMIARDSNPVLVTRRPGASRRTWR